MVAPYQNWHRPRRQRCVRPSLGVPTIYAAVDLDAALESAVKKQESELREIEERKGELQELVNTCKNS
ncbi:MAG TPA: hypothetical protein VEF35_01330 [Candidatus Bathyarchaeia archaeon]|nr:hypothetical protein [Candidatus Bathyarchaeia archaeon]